MKTGIIPQFKDSPGLLELIYVADKWQKPEIPAKLKNIIKAPGQVEFHEFGDLSGVRIRTTENLRFRKYLEKLLISWLYDFIRLNIKRGRIFELNAVLQTGLADCLGYAKIFTTLGRYCGLDAGVIEVIIDNRGANVPHSAAFVALPDGRPQFVDLWYGSMNIKHRRLGLRVKHVSKWQIEDIDYQFLKGKSVTYLPDSCVDGITLYIEGNRSLKNGDYQQAVRLYSDSIRLYPRNARTFYNRAVAHENLGNNTKAKADYTRALKDNASLLRTLSTQPEEIVDLIHLDEKAIPEADQRIYLLYHGFITGKKVPPSRISRGTGLPLKQIHKILENTRQSLSR